MLLVNSEINVEDEQKTKQVPSPGKKSTLRSRASGIGTFIFFTLVCLALVEGWQMRSEHIINAERGVGYILGIAGGSMMLLLLMYPLRKRFKALRVLGAVKHWFRLHMILGILGPSLILFHANFGLGALNSNVALACMLIVASSGLLGRYFYTRIHHGLYGSQATVQELQQESAWSLAELKVHLSFYPEFQQALKNYEAAAIKAGKGLFSFIKIPLLDLKSHFSYLRLWRQCRKAIRKEVTDAGLQLVLLRQVQQNLRTYFIAMRKMAEFGFYTRLFSLWHVLHLPLFVMMLITGVIHVIYVHMY
jgi:hypothetical protein